MYRKVRRRNKNRSGRLWKNGGTYGEKESVKINEAIQEERGGSVCTRTPSILFFHLFCSLPARTQKCNSPEHNCFLIFNAAGTTVGCANADCLIECAGTVASQSSLLCLPVFIHSTRLLIPLSYQSIGGTTLEMPASPRCPHLSIA